VVGVGILGAGGIARAHARAYRALPDRCRLVAVADVVSEAAESFARELGGGVAAYADPQALLARQDVDLVSVCTPPFTHAPLALEALRAGKHVLVEKPMATGLDECDVMLEAAERVGRTLAVVHQNRFRPEFLRLKALVDGGHLGPLDYVGVHCLWWRGPRYYERWWRGTWDREGGGALLNHAIHALDLLVWIAGLPEEVDARLATRAHPVEVEDLAVALLRFSNGALGQFTGTVDVHLDGDRFEVAGRRAAAAVPWRLAALADTGDGFGRPDEALVAELEAVARAVPVPAHPGHGALVEAVVACLERGTPPPVTGADGRRAVELAVAIYRAAAERAPTRLPLAPSDPYYAATGLRARLRASLARGR
jgi:UDP-N-acetyl-2-amino-2-deoxyglucuronate dehydrogenase